jgi:hypothetical protein
MQKFAIAEETIGYVTAEDETNADKRLLTTGSKNVLIDRNRKVKTRPGYVRLGAGNDALTPVRNAFTWYTSTGTELPLRFYDDEWEVWLGTVDTVEIDAWTRFKDGMNTSAIVRGATFFDTAENIDEMILVQGDADLFEWNGAVAVVDSITGTTITKKGTSTFAQNRFYASANKTLVCVRTGTEYTYTGGETTTTLTGIADTTGLQDGDILIQKVVTASNKPAANHTNHTIFSFENQIIVGSDDDNEAWISQNDDYADFSYSSPRLSGEGGLLTLDGPCKAFGSIGSTLLAFAGRQSIFKANYEQIAVGEVLAETLKVKRLNTGVDQGAFNQETCIPVGNSLIYLSYEPALRIIDNPDDLGSSDPKTLSNPIKPDFDAEDWENASSIWHKNAYYLSAPSNSRLFILEFVEDADGKVRRFWNPPQILPIGPKSIIGDALHGHSNAVPETYELFTGTSDIIPNGTVGDPDSKVPFQAIAAFSYNLFGDREALKSFDEYFVEGEITPATTDLGLLLNYDYGGSTQTIQRTIDGSDEDILEGSVGFNSLGQQSLAQNPLGGLLNPPSDARKFNVTFELAREDFRMMQAVFSTNEIDRYWAITAHGPNVTKSPRRNISHRK